MIEEVAERFFPEQDFPDEFYRLRKEYSAKVRSLLVDDDKKSLPWANCQVILLIILHL